MIISTNNRYIESTFENEEEIEQIVFDNYEYLFGPSSFLLPKKLIKTSDGFGTIPDGFAIDLASRKWYLVEAELIKHSVYGHIAQQVTKQIIACRQDMTRKLLIEIAVNQYNESQEIKDKFSDEDIAEINVRRVLSEILETEPIVGIPIDKTSNDLNEWARTLKSTVKLWIIKKFVDLNDRTSVLYEFPEDYRPDVDTEENSECDDTANIIKSYDVSITNLIEKELLHVGDTLYMKYGPKSGEKKEYSCQVQDDGNLLVMDQLFTSPSYAALYCINHSGSSRKTVNGWTSWKSESGELLSQLRDRYLEMGE